jgi:hypothetical protein
MPTPSLRVNLQSLDEGRSTRPAPGPRLSLAPGLNALDLPHRIGRDGAVSDGPSHPLEITLRHLFAVDALALALIEAITPSTSGVVASPSRTWPMAGNTWACNRPQYVLDRAWRPVTVRDGGAPT